MTITIARLCRTGWLLACLITACSAGDGEVGRASIPPQYWGDIQVRLETRPEPVRPGMNEFLIIATQKRGLPAYNMIVSLRTNTGQPWRQAIEDGESGVYRRALAIRDADRRLEVQIRQPRQGKEIVLHFPLHPE